MARPRKFEEGRAVEAAMRAFWRAGYEATSTEDLCAATGLGRSSIYNTFTGKRELFLRALRHYMDERDAALVELMDGELPIREKVATVLGWAVEPDPGDPAGCLVVNSMIELAPRDDDVAELLRRDNDLRTRILRAAFEDARARGELGPGKDPLALARFVVATVSGLRVLARGGAGGAALASVARTALDAI
ncbi:TetR/AcrR family transcriptional regulator [Actinomadura sp. ATCC 31491]|uniref:TetR/AcrR family transcriptional regulator n=1 Tax=Actinomadura luzonensis TaxID=2805427 RepID=A0ABT0FYJ1_9ACTN|nr:TetR/AcrR family transcriptional regulator [Actinomadura luzonensis]MCK2217419.1 TetR/AcrR family transcriptional regulator [Actinomadura luzonensis]